MQRTLIIGAAIGLWLLGLLIEDRVSGWMETAFGVFAFLTIAGLWAGRSPSAQRLAVGSDFIGQRTRRDQRRITPRPARRVRATLGLAPNCLRNPREKCAGLL